MNTDDLIIDCFAGGGGASTGIEAALGRPIDIAVNHDYTGAKYSTANQVAKIGNSVVPIMAKLLVQANCCNGEEATQNENC